MSSTEDDIASLRARLEKSEARLDRQGMQIRVGFAIVGVALLLPIFPAPVVWILILLLLLGIIAAGRYAFVAILNGMIASTSDDSRSREKGADADRASSIDSPAG